ncbi:MAG: pyrimidine-nucleoside phosphorylase [Bacillota bacterium]|nr:pyrimidine-nucleoside phosphorylase [Bacillota bacterium]
MRVYDLIRKKRDGGELSAAELEFLVKEYTAGTLPDYQMAAFLMAVFFRGLNAAETTALTLAMAHSGEMADLSSLPGITVDKHSTGGVADTTTLVLAPLVAACGVTVAKMSGRGLGHTGGTVDKLESIPGFRTALSRQEFFDVVKTAGMAVVGQSGELCPADKKMYALRDVTATVDCLPLIAASIMSKKLAGGSQAIVLDVKCGRGAFLKDLAQARELARAMVAIGERAGRKTVAVISDMSQPLGMAIGNALEVREAVTTLAGKGPQRLTDLCLTLGGEMVALAGRASDPGQGRALVAEALASGRGLEQFERWVAAQGGDPAVAREPERLPQAPVRLPVRSQAEGYVIAVEAERLGLVAMELGAGRQRKDDPVDLRVGLEVRLELGSRVEVGQEIALIHAASEQQAREAAASVLAAYSLGPKPAERPPLVYEVVRAA